MKKMGKFRKGAASFYIVAISTLILVIVAASFAAVIISEVTRTSNDDLAQSAYDSALAGVEDAKLAYYNYQNCLEGKAGMASGIDIGDDTVSCEEIRYLVEKSDSCDMTAIILGRIDEYDVGDEEEVSKEREVLIEENIEDGGSNNMQQAYTCVKLSDALVDYRTTLTSSNPTKVMRAKFDGTGVAKSIKSIRVSWQGDRDTSDTKYAGFGSAGIFGVDAPLPPVISVGLVQTAGTFSLSDFEMTQGSQTDRGTIYLVPSDNKDGILDEEYNQKRDSYINAYDSENKVNLIKNYLETGEVASFLKSNSKTAQNLPYAVKCVTGSDFACQATIELPDPVNGNRSDETFMIVLSMPYARSNTDVKLEFCSSATVCSEGGTVEVEGETKVIEDTRVSLKGVQLKIDSTGRANDLYRRVETRLEPADTAYPYPLYAIQLLGSSGDGSLIKKSLSPTCEWNFEATGPRGICKDTE